jgi:hypothetical protein
MNQFISSFCKRYALPLLALLLLCGCSSLPAAQTTSTPTPTASAAAQPSPTPTPAPQSVFPSYVGKWEVHDALMTIKADQTGLMTWNAGPCGSAGLCGGNAPIVFTVNADGSIQGTIQSVTYSQGDGSPAPSDFQPSPDDVQAGYMFQLQHSGAHLLYTTWLGAAASAGNSGNRYWCDPVAASSGWSQCGA